MRLIAALKLFRLALVLSSRALLKTVLLTTLILMSTVVFLGVAELSRASTSSLDEAIESDLGATGTYRVTPASDLGLTLGQLIDTVKDSTQSLTREPVGVIMGFPSVHPECPPYNQLGDISAAILLDERGLPLPFEAAGLSATTADLCLAGLRIPNSAVRQASPKERHIGASIIIDPAYAREMVLSSAGSMQFSFVISTGVATDQTGVLKQALEQGFRDSASQASIDPRNAVVVSRSDSGDLVRSASDGIRIVYAIIGWGVLGIGGVGVLVAELIVLRDRTWFFGLARAVGARKMGVASLVVADILIVLVAGLVLAVLLILSTRSVVSSFGREAFQVDLQLLRPEALPGLAGALLFMLVLGGAYPAWRATRLDPLEVLERR